MILTETLKHHSYYLLRYSISSAAAAATIETAEDLRCLLDEVISGLKVLLEYVYSKGEKQ